MYADTPHIIDLQHYRRPVQKARVGELVRIDPSQIEVGSVVGYTIRDTFTGRAVAAFGVVICWSDFGITMHHNLLVNAFSGKVSVGSGAYQRNTVRRWSEVAAVFVVEEFASAMAA